MKKLNIFELKRIIKKIIKEEAATIGHEEILKMDYKGDFFTIDKEGNIKPGLHSRSQFFKDHFNDIAETFKKVYHENILLIEINDKNFEFNVEEGDLTFDNIRKDEIKNQAVKALIDNNKNKKIIILHPSLFSSGESLFKYYTKNDELKYNVGFWLLHDIGHSFIDNEDNLQSKIRDLEDFLRREIKENHPLKNNSYKEIVLFIAEKMQITRNQLTDFHSDDYTDILQNFIFVTYFKNIENNLNNINFEEFINFLKSRYINNDFSFLLKIIGVKEYFDKIRKSIIVLVDKVKNSFGSNEKPLIDKDVVTLIGVSGEKLRQEEAFDYFNKI
jgi:hypothetical protein